MVETRGVGAADRPAGLLDCRGSLPVGIEVRPQKLLEVEARGEPLGGYVGAVSRVRACDHGGEDARRGDACCRAATR